MIPYTLHINIVYDQSNCNWLWQLAWFAVITFFVQVKLKCHLIYMFAMFTLSCRQSSCGYIVFYGCILSMAIITNLKKVIDK